MRKSLLIFVFLITSLSFSQETFEFDFSGSIETWVVPDSGVFTIETYGAQGGNYYEDNAPNGAKMSGDFILSSGDIIKILVGEKGHPGDYPEGGGTISTGGGGGGGTFVVRDDDTPLIIAGGGGGGNPWCEDGECVGQIGNSGGDTWNDGGGENGEGGNSGGNTQYAKGSGGGGFYTDGQDGYWDGCTQGGNSFLNGGAGGIGGVCWGGEEDWNGGNGGFGGGGGGWQTSFNGGGGGGGYSGGQGGWSRGENGGSTVPGGGGGSYNDGNNQDNEAGNNEGHGRVVITANYFGCLDDNAYNYNPEATIDDGSCEYYEGIVINEIMQNPSSVSDSDGEWFEIFNGDVVSVNLNGWIITDNGTDEHLINSDVIIEPGGYGVLGNNSDYGSNGGVTIDYEYYDFSLGNSDDEIILIFSLDYIADSVAYDGGLDFPDPSGASMALLNDSLDNSVGTNWIESNTMFGDGDMGTPGVPNFDAEITLSDTSIVMDTTWTGSSSTKELTIYNTGTELLTLESLSTVTDEFSVSPENGTVFIDSSLVITITFSPDYPDYSGSYSDVLTIVTDDFENPTSTVALSGYGYRPIPLIDLPSILTFQDTPEFHTSSETITITNTGDTTLTIYSISSSIEVFQPGFADTIIEMGNSIDLDIVFAPINHQSYSGVLTVLSDAYQMSSVEVEMSGNGVRYCDIEVSTDELDFGEVQVGLSLNLNMLIQNIGSIHDLNINSIVTGDEAFSVLYTDTLVAPGDTIILPIQFVPLAVQNYNTNMTIFSNDPDEGNVTVNLTGTGLEPNPEIAVDVSSINFGDSIGINETVLRYVNIQNIGLEDLEVELTLGLIDDSPFSIDINELSLGYNESGTVTLSFTNEDDNFARDTLFIDSNDPYNNLILIPLQANTHSGPVWYVSTTGSDSNEGSVVNPFASIQHGIDVASDGDTVLVSAGTYVENINYNGKNIVVGSLMLTTQDTSYISSTIIDGNQAGSVVTFETAEDSTAVLSGFTIQNGSGFNGDGGGIYCYSSSPSLMNVTITGNSAIGTYSTGGGIWCQYSNPILENVTITGNSASWGGGVRCEYSSPTLTNVMISGNSSSDDGGGISCWNNSNPILENVTITGNSSPHGGGICCITNSSPILVNTIVSENSGDYGIYVYSGNPSITYSDFYNNEDGNYYIVNGGINWGEGNINSDPLFCNADSSDFTLYDNSPCVGTGQDGANMGAYDIGCEAENTVTDIDGNVYETIQIGDQVWMAENLKVTHYRNGDEIPTGYSGGDWAGLSTGAYAVYDDNESNADTYGYLYNWYAIDDSRIIAPEGWHVPTDEEFMELEMYLGMSESEANSTGWRGTNEGSKLAGNAGLWDNGDLENNSEFGTSGFSAFPAGYRYDSNGSYYSMGEYGYFWQSSEYASHSGWGRLLSYSYSNVARGGNYKQAGFSIRCLFGSTSGITWHISETGSDSNDGSEENPFATIQHGIDVASDGDTVLVSAGTYVENINFNGKNIAVIGEDRETTIIDGNQAGSVVTFESGEDSTAVLSGLTVMNGFANNGNGGGINCRDWSNPTLMYLIIKNNYAGGTGGGVICQTYSSPKINNVIVEGNTAGNNGGGIYCEYNSNPDIVNVSIYNNIANTGGGLQCSTSNPLIKNVTIADNIANNYGGGIYCGDAAQPELVNTIVWDNAPEEVYFYDTGDVSSITISYSDIQGGENGIVTNDNGTVFWGAGNIDADPLFTDPENGDYTLQPNSPCIDAGDPDLNGDGEDYTTDTDDQDPDGTRMDMGAYYYDQSSYSGPTWHVSTSGSDDNNGSEGSPFASIQHGMGVSSDGDTVLVQPGTYVENIDYSGKSIVVGSLTLTTGDTSYISQTVINGNGSDVVTIENEEGESTVLTGFSIVNGNTGIRCTGSSPLLDNLIIREMTGYSIGVRVRYDAFVRLRNSEIHNNKIGVLVISTGNLVAESLKIHHNTNESDGGAGLYVNSNLGSDIPAIATISHSIFHNNTGTYSGAIRNEGQLWLTNVTISQNVATFEGASGGIWQATQLDYYPDPGEEAIVHMRNCILYGNTPAENYEIQDNNDLRPTCWDLDYNNIEINTFPDHCYYQIGENNQYNIDPLFTDPVSYDFTLQSTSPCIDTGDPDLDGDGYTWEDDPDDQDPDGTRLDMGAYYYQEPAPIVSISSSESSPTNASPIPITATFSMDVTGFVQSDVNVGNGSIGNFSGSGSNYSFDVTPASDGEVTVDIPEDVAQDDQGNGNFAAQQFSIIYDGTAPTMTIASTLAIDPEVTTLAGSGSLGSADGTGTAASFNRPYGVAVDLSGNVYVADTYNHLIRKITSAGVVTTLAGSGSEGSADGTGTAASFYLPFGVAVDGSGNVYVADNNNHLIRKITSAGVVTTLAGSGSEGSANGTGTAASFHNPRGVAVDLSGNVYVAEYGNHLIRKITSAGVVTTLAGTGSSGSANGTGTEASFNAPEGVAVDLSGNVYVADTENHLIRKITSAGVVTTLAGNGVGYGDASDGTGTEASFYLPYGVAVDGSGNVYVADQANHLIRKITSAGVVTTFAGSGSQGSLDGTGTAASFNFPQGVAVDISGNVYVADSYNYLIRKIATTLASGSTTNDATLPLIFTSSEATTDFAEEDITVTNGALSSFAASSSTVYTATFTPTDDGVATIDVAASTFTDAAGNGNTEASQFSILYDSNMFADNFEDLNGWVNTTNSGSPGNEWYIDANGYIGNCAKSDVGGYGYGDQLTQSFTFNSEVVVRLWVKKQAGDAVRIYFKVNGTDSWVFGEVGDPGSTWVLKETTIPAGTHTISIETDFAGYAWVDELEIQTNFSPVATISSSFTSPTSVSPIPITVTFSMDVTSFVQSDVDVGNGSIGNFSGSGSDYTFNITPASDGEVTVDIPEDVAQDDQGNGNLAAAFSITYDGTSPSAVVSSEELSPTHNSPFAVEIVFSEPVLDFDQEDLEIVNGSVTTFSGADSLYNIDLTPAADGTVSISLDENMAYDPAGNGNLATNTLEIYYDNLPPIVDVTDIGEAGTLDTLTIEWQSSDVSTIEKHTIYVTNDGQNYSLLDSTSGDVFTYDWVIPNALSDQNRIAVEASDEWGLVAADTTVVFAIVDNDLPVVSIIEPNAGYSIPEYELLTVRWEAGDNIGIDSVKVLYSNDGGVEYVLMGSLTDPAIDSLTFAVPFGVTDSARVNIIALDAHGNSGLDTTPDFTVTDNTPPVVELLSPQSGAEIEIAAIEELMWDATDNVGIIAVDLHYSIDGGSSWSAIVEGEENTGLYSWLVPNAPSNDVALRLIGHDAVGLSDTSHVTGLSIIIVYPIVTAIDPQPGLLTWRDSQFSVTFSQAMSSIEDESIAISSGYSGSVIASAVVTHADESNTLTIEFPSGFASLDTVTITLQSSSISNIYDYGLDGNGDGEPGDDYTVQYTTAMLADYDNSDTLDVLDLAQFVQALEEDNYYYELGPVSGEVPHFISSLDFTYDIEDVMAFVMMWNWYYTTFGGQFLSYESMGDQMSIETSPDSLIVTIPEGTVAYQIFVQHYPGNVQFSAPEQKSDLQLVSTSEEGIFSLAAAAWGNRVSIPLDISGKKARIAVTLVAVGYDNEVLSRSTKEVVIDNIPEAYALGQNYPNPFNPVTLIEYELPDDAHMNLAIYDVLGRKIRTLVSGMQPAGYAEVRWNGTDDWGNKVGTGIYFYRIETGTFSKTHKMVLMK